MRCISIHIGKVVLLDASVSVIGGVTIDGSVTATEAIATKDILSRVVSSGWACKVIEPKTEADRIKPD